ncbi:hypothetical protein C0995_011321 [Termitomyces sp. Mi166|nr:hypothetical protein C0995_011321 [Termitomyces sp. Mi166\
MPPPSQPTTTSQLSTNSPIQMVYPSARTLPPLPPLPQPSISTGTPSLGFSSLMTLMQGSSAASNANQARLAHAATVLPLPRPALACQGTNRTGGPSSAQSSRAVARSPLVHHHTIKMVAFIDVKQLGFYIFIHVIWSQVKMMVLGAQVVRQMKQMMT